MTDRELMQMALDALEAMQSYARAEKKGLRICDESIEALRERLSQPEPKCPPCNGDCNQGRDCPARKITIEAA